MARERPDGSATDGGPGKRRKLPPNPAAGYVGEWEVSGERMRAANAMPDRSEGERGLLVALAFHRLDAFTPSDAQILAECSAVKHRRSLVRVRKRLRAAGILDWIGENGKKIERYTKLDLSGGDGPNLSPTSDRSPTGHRSPVGVEPITDQSHEPDTGSAGAFPDLSDLLGDDVPGLCGRHCGHGVFLTPGIPCPECGKVGK